MSYIKQVKRSSPEFTPLVRLVEKVRGGKYGNPENPITTELIKSIIKEHNGIDIGEHILNQKESYTPVDFGDEQNYLIFMLRWT